MTATILAVSWLFLAYSLLAVGTQLVLLVSASLSIRREARLTSGEFLRRLLRSPVTPSISIVAPAYNEEATLPESVRALLTLNYTRLQVIVVNDGSSDRTLDLLRERYDLVEVASPGGPCVPTARVRAVLRSRKAPGLLVVDKENGGRSDALNAGLNVATGDLVCAIDADTLLEGDALLRVVRPFLGDDDVAAAGGTIRVVNSSSVHHGRVVAPRVSTRPLAGIQTVEYLRAFHLGRLGWNRLGGNLIVSGAFGLFRREDMLACGGFEVDTIGEDMEFVVRLRRNGIERRGRSRVVFVPDPTAWTEVPESMRVLGAQRDRWQRGLADVLRRHRPLIGNPRYGAVGLALLPYYTLIELLGPVIEALGLVCLVAGLLLHVVDPAFAAALFLVGYGWGVPVTMAAVVMDQLAYGHYRRARDRALLLLWAILENLGYRQLTVVWRLRGMVRYARGSRVGWGAMTRRGFGA